MHLDTPQPGSYTEMCEQRERVLRGKRLTTEQIANWRQVLTTMLGPYALLMTEEQIQCYRDRFQAVADAKAEEAGE